MLSSITTLKELTSDAAHAVGEKEGASPLLDDKVRSKSLFSRVYLPLALAIAFMASAGTTQAAPIMGTFDITGSVTVSGTSLDFGSNGAADGLFSITGATGYFSGYSAGLANAGDNRDLSVPPGVANVTHFVDFLLGPRSGFFIDMTFLAPGGGPACPPGAPVGASCTVAGSPLLITRSGTNPNNTTVTMSFTGTATNGADSGIASGLFTAQFLGQSPEQLLATINAGGTISTSYSATLGVGVPEPASVTTAVFGLGLMGFGVWRRRRE